MWKPPPVWPSGTRFNWQISGPLSALIGLIRVDLVHAATVDLSRPLLVVPLPYAPPPGNRLVVDGWHRIHRALSEGRDRLPAVLLDEGDELACRLHGGGP